jgi:hypothetical protein
MLPYIVIDFFLNNQPGALIIQFILLKNSTCFGHIRCPSSGVLYCTFGTDKFHAVFDDRFQADCLETVIKNLHETYQCRMYSRELLVMGSEDARNI